jgi:hypothetical protein
MALLTNAQIATLTENGRNRRRDHWPVVKLFTPDAQATWLLSEIDAEHPDIAFGLCDLGFGTPELGIVSLSEITSLRGNLGLPVERDEHFEATHPISVYAQAARAAHAITEDFDALESAAVTLKARGRG